MTRRITAVTPTIAAALGVAPPAGSEPEPLAELGGARVRRVLVYAPDAIGSWLVREHPAEFDRVRRHAPTEIALASVPPTWTPVCFASMFTGAGPEYHGIAKYEKRALACETLFDAVAAAGLRTAIVTVANSSVDHLFREKPADHFALAYDPHGTEKALEVLRANEHDLVVVYHQEYDDLIHRTQPRSCAALAAMRRHVASFETLAAAAREAWADAPGLVLFTPDHGTPFDPKTGRGTHGSERPEDVEVTHFLGA